MLRLFDFEEKKVIYEEDATKANELIDAGKAVKLELPELERYEKAAADIHDEYSAKVKQIKTSDNPLLQDKKVREYELNRLKQEYEQKSQEIEAEYLAYRDKAIQEAKVKAARAVVKVTEADKLTAEQFATRAALNLAAATDKGAALKRIADDINLLTDEQKTALQGEIVRVLSTVDDDYHIDKQAVISAVKDIRNSDLLAYEVARQLPHTVLTKQRQQAIVEQVVNEPSAMTGGNIDREFYEENLKGKGSFNA